ncbi:CoA pyrophosphatase [Phenylobacterium montanum]|uniref:CoA pyrophosphatase n=1 Tax=Phenylobacterium montanum TaxID=2823693 RepID=A0A975ITZ7_9CAUL|nr:CoA pyrophosphatase [Caulobacter sp. S6]QUD87240.1 CoA pyrophosphatase [Caulobacter sp. S6]
MKPADLRAWVQGRLDPIEAYGAAVGKRASDFDLNPGQLNPAQDRPLSPAAVLVPLVEHEDGVTVLLTRRADTLRSHTGQVALPGGRCDPGEWPWDTALREAEEEVGLARDFVTLAGLSTPYQTGSGFDITPVVGFVRPGFALVPNPAEVAEIFEAPFAFLMNPDNHERRSMKASDGMLRHFYAMPYQEQLIWGATAGMLRALYERLFGAEAA